MNKRLFTYTPKEDRKSQLLALPGAVSAEGKSATEALMDDVGAWNIEKRPVRCLINGEMGDVPNEYALVRSPMRNDNKEVMLGRAKGWYKPLQPTRIAELFDQHSYVDQINAMGYLGDGDKLFISWPLAPIRVGKEEINVNGFFAAGFDGLFGVLLSVISFRVCCCNMWRRAIRESTAQRSSGDSMGQVWKGRHTSPNLERDLAIYLEEIAIRSMERAGDMSLAFNNFAKTPVRSEAHLADILFGIAPDPEPVSEDTPKSLKNEKEAKYLVKKAKAEEYRGRVSRLMNGEGTEINSADPTLWDVWNAITEDANWYGERPGSANSALFGNKAAQMNNAYAYLLAEASI